MDDSLDSSKERGDTDDTASNCSEIKTDESGDSSEQTTTDSGVATDPQQTEEKDVITDSDIEDINVEKEIKQSDEQEIKADEKQEEQVSLQICSKEAENQAKNENNLNLEDHNSTKQHLGQQTTDAAAEDNEDAGEKKDTVGSSTETNEKSKANENLADSTTEDKDSAGRVLSESGDRLIDNQEGEVTQSHETKASKEEDEFELDNSYVEEATELEVENEIPLYLNEVGVFRNGREYIKKKNPMKKKIDQLGFSARLLFSGLDIKLHNEGCLMTTDDNFLAKVQINYSNLVDKTVNYAEAKKTLLKQLKIVHVLQDDLTANRNALQQALLEGIQNTFAYSSEDGKLAVDGIQLCYIINTHHDTFNNLCERIKFNRLISQELRKNADAFLLAQSRSIARDMILANFGHYRSATNNTDLIIQLRGMLNKYGMNCRKRLLEKAPTYLHPTLNNISNERIMFIRNSDIKLFSDMTGVLNEKIFQKPMADLAIRWTEHMGKMNIKKLLSVEPQTNPIFYYLAKSLEELIVEISSRTAHAEKDLLISRPSGWSPIREITWKSTNAFTKCLEQEYYFIFKLLKYFDFGPYTKKSRFQYDVKLFEGPKKQSTWKQVFKNTKSFFGFGSETENSLNIADEKYVWYCLLDHVLYHILPADYKFDCFGNIIQSYVDFLISASRDQLETIRVITHNTARFVVQTMDYVGQSDSSSIDRQILQKQLNLINAKSIQNSLSSNSFRDLIDVFNMYWKNREDIITGISAKICRQEVTLLKTDLLETVSIALDKNVTPDAMVSFFRSYSDLLVDLNDVQFDWYIKSLADISMNPIVDLGLIKLVNNKWATTTNKTYLVVEVEKFSKSVPVLFDNLCLPKHYILEILSTLLSYIKNQLLKTNWKSGEQLSEMEQISTTNELIFAVRNSFLYLKEQPDYVSFESFFDERIKPFTSAIENSDSHRDFTNRIYLIKELFWYIRKQSEMAIDQALELFGNLNSAAEIEVLRSAYHKYAECFQRFMEESNDVAEYNTKASQIAKNVLELTFQKSHSAWNSDDKWNKIPEILAGLAAVWSILVSKDVSSTGKYLTPHCIQILCILRLLSVDKATEGVVSHLAQVLTGQGKSLVLGLTAALLALTGHKARIVCYNEYLVLRDKLDFKFFFAMFKVSKSILYSTFEDMANNFIAPVVDGERAGLRNLVEQRLLGNEQHNRSKLVAEDMRNSVLLIDEVDVFFTPQFYGSVFGPCAQLMLPGLDSIQEEIWKIVSQRNCQHPLEIEKTIYRYMGAEKMKKEFHRFIVNSEVHTILVQREGKVATDHYSNKKLFEEHLKIMIKCAIDVYTYPVDNWNDYKLSERGTILCKDNGKYVNNGLNSYYTLFNYFRMRGSNFITVVGNETNYGYFVLECGSISYAILPKSYPLILGASGTLSELNQYEKQSIANVYNISKTSIMPTYFGSSNLSFDRWSNFSLSKNISEWNARIFVQVNAILGMNRSVLVFFETDLLLNRFQIEYSGQFDRLNVLTENTNSALINQYIDEAGVSKTVTLATAGMGRGVDYKSSVAIEKRGGLHVIQTFFSLDVKEETQIKGRTARKDNHGSYELIVCQNHLTSAGLWLNNMTYDTLHAARLSQALGNNRQLLENIDRYKYDHDVTMRYMKSFFEQ